MWPNPFARSSVVDTQVFYPRLDGGSSTVNGTTVVNSWQTWTKPNGCSFVFMLMIAAGGGGGRVSSTTLGAGGGGSGGHTRLLIPALFLPETLFIWPGSGGLGATATAVAGANGQPSIVACEPYTAASNVAATSTVGSYVLYQTGGQGGAGSASTGGPAGAIALITDQSIASSGLWFSIAGQIGAAGATVSNGAGSASTAFASGIITSSGGGGGNGSGTGGGITANLGPFNGNVSGGTGGAAPTSGPSGINLNQRIEYLMTRGYPIYFMGGAGGGGSNVAGTTGGLGGDASYGGGGGGGGGNNASGTNSGSGGDGGDGLIIIMAW